MTMHLAREIEKLKKRILTLGSEVEDVLQQSVQALDTMDGSLAATVAEGDNRIDTLEVDLEEECLKVLALYQPVANDLRFIISVLKINNDLERIADLAVNISERVLDLLRHERIPVPFQFSEMSGLVSDMVKKSLDSLVNLDQRQAREVIALDDQVDALHHNSYGLVKDRIRKNPNHIEPLICYLVVSRYLERIADQATNIAEDVLYLIEGKIVRHTI
ncbi:MAG: phosphate signaling complex protein PhoU [Syntrophotaleaceae bacterium]